ncbi:MAG: MurR/RpiR family transcriptional regulator [Firmicutes bacterium]|nr:MurR/RpiR family transcriptional regulator [Oscillospiraceae bacterium]MBS5433768.1 MurR/RpiR family transcriptional regulator [Bacillota bacterium]
MKESLFYIQRINALYNTGAFSKSDRLLADYFLANPCCVNKETASSLSLLTGVSPATIVRFCRKLGFDGLADMKKSIAYSNYIESTASDMDLAKGDDAETVKNKVIQYTKMIVDQLQVSLDASLLQKAADMIGSAAHVVIVGEGGSGTICRAAYDIFLKLAIPCRFVEDIMFQMMEISMMGENDVLLFIINSGRTYNVLQNAEYARDRGLATIGIVGSPNSPLSRFLDVELQTSMFSSSYFSDISAARLCELTTVSILHSILALTRNEEQMEKGDEIAMSIERKRISLK